MGDRLVYFRKKCKIDQNEGMFEMGRKSTKENKNIYFTSREDIGYSREMAAEKLQFISADRIERIEHEKTVPHPEEILAMADCYKNPALCNYFCSHECPIGKEYVPAVEAKDLTQITLELLDTLNKLTKQKDRFIEISVDGKLSDDELPDFLRIKEELEKMSLVADSLNLWLSNAVVDGGLDHGKL